MNTLAQAIGDPKIPAMSLAVLAYMTDNPDATMAQVISRFNKSRSWWSRSLKPLKEGNYIKHVKTKDEEKQQWSHEYFITEEQTIEQTITIKPTVPKIYNTSPKTKWLDPLTTPKDDYDIKKFYLDHSFPAPQTAEELLQAKQPGMRAWATITSNYIGWVNAKQVNEILGASPNKEALKLAWKEWQFSRYRPSNIRGILDWYTILNKDIKATPWSNKRRNNNGHGTARQGSRKVRKEHGNSSVSYNANEFTSITLDSDSTG